MGKVSQLESMVKALQEDLKKVTYWLLVSPLHKYQHRCRLLRTVFILPSGERCQGVSPGSDPEPAGGQPAPAGGVLQRLGQAQEVHRVGFQHHRYELKPPTALL